MSEFALWNVDHWSLDGFAALDWRVAPGPVAALLFALLSHLLTGWLMPRSARGPMVLVEHGAKALELRLNRRKRSDAARLIRGLLIVVVIAGLAAAAGWAVMRYARPVPYGWVVEIAILASLFGVWNGVRLAGDVARALRRSRPDDARELLARRHRTARDYSDDHALARGGIEECVRELLHGLAGPVFWYLLLGLPGVLAYRAIETVDGIVGRRDPARAGFGLVPARLEDAASWLPARLTGVLLALAGGFVPGGSPLRVWRAISKARSAGAASAAAWVIAAAAGGSGLSLGGTARWNGISVTSPWLGSGRARAVSADLRRAVWLVVVTTALMTAGLGLLAATRYLA